MGREMVGEDKEGFGKQIINTEDVCKNQKETIIL